MSTIEQPAMQSDPCVICGGRNYPLSMGGPSVCPACDCGVSPQTTKLLNELIRTRAERDEARDWAIAAKLESAEARTKLESLQKACAEKDTVLSRILPEFMYEESFLSQRGKLTKQMLEHALSADCGKDFVPKSQLEAAQQRIEKLVEVLKKAQDCLIEAHARLQIYSDPLPKLVGETIELATEALENEKSSDTPITP